ncbi:MAG: secretin N-terminal domain-containing protein [Planctomycetota bacterium]
METSEKPLDVVLQWISRRAGVNLVTNELDLPKVTIRLVNVTWQEAVAQIAQRYDFIVEQRSERIWELTRPPKVRMEFQDALLTVVLDALARQAGINIVISDRVDSGRRLTMKLNGVPWREALDVIVRSTGYEWIEGKYNIVRVVDPADVQRDLHTRVFRLDYASAEDLESALEGILSTGGSESSNRSSGGGSAEIDFDERTNSLIITDTEIHLERAAAVLAELDERTEEVQLEIRFVEFNTTDAQTWGFNGASFDLAIDDFGTASGLLSPFSSSVGLDYSRPAPSSTALLSGDYTFEAAASLVSSEVIQAPTVMALDNREAVISLTRSQSYAEEITTLVDGEVVRSLQEATGSPLESGIVVTVTPHITSDGFVAMDIEASDSNASLEDVAISNSSIQLPDKREKKVISAIMVPDGETAVIGGLTSTQIDQTERWVPVLGRIPLLGYLFRYEDETETKRVLNIFIRPRIVEFDEYDSLDDAKLRLREELSGLKLRRDVGDAQPGE